MFHTAGSQLVVWTNSTRHSVLPILSLYTQGVLQHPAFLLPPRPFEVFDLICSFGTSFVICWPSLRHYSDEKNNFGLLNSNLQPTRKPEIRQRALGYEWWHRCSLKESAQLHFVRQAGMWAGRQVDRKTDRQFGSKQLGTRAN